MALSGWFVELGEDDRVRVMEVARMAAHGATFGVLAALDGSRKIADGELRLTDESGHVLAATESSTELHDLFQAEVGDWLTA
ncbi:hypothetical protein [Nocardioides baekrokdamisoli]|uniref:hypothetical protein n=1 Tax=Nocardioides baekrokdamisoli TaxID=1804624 RepID=UPI000F7A72CE|nr:hypothetical protein [Nocardioides baekrokdamisoli]